MSADILSAPLAVPAPPRLGPVGANLICLLSMLVWAAGLPAADLVIGLVPPLQLTALRCLLAGSVLVALWALVEGPRAVLDAPWLRGLCVGGVAIGLASVFLIIAQAATDAVTVAVISATMPVIGIALECLLDGRRFSARLGIGLALSLAGGVLAYAASLGALTFGIGALAALISILAYTWGSRATVTMLPGLTPLGRSAITVAGAAVCALVLAGGQIALGTPWPDLGAFGWREIGGLFAFSVGSLAISQLLWIVSVGSLGIGAASLHMNAVPFYVMLIVFLLGGAWNWPQAGGAAVVVLGVIIAQSRPRRES
ncbi:DMT family transporter [Xinfangfangia pollutisoli]|uniref:DMT family transporter n=1 Tax=Xinfangfangia pollutisoli TaxID=2865960 RepID=UPI001CD32AAE|nr:DMT family transporter [Xinfangfangia pollutisoli]